MTRCPRWCPSLRRRSTRTRPRSWTGCSATYDNKAGHVADWIRTEYYSASGRCVVNTQTAYVVSLHYGFGDPDFSARELKRLLDENDGKLTCGFVGAPLLCLALSEAGMHGYAYDLLLGEGYPGWLYAVKLGATTIWERWNSLDEEGRITGTDMPNGLLRISVKALNASLSTSNTTVTTFSIIAPFS